MKLFNWRKKAQAEFSGENTYDEDAVNTIKSSGIFDRDWHLDKYPDLEQVGDVEAHYYFTGWMEGRQPSYLFDSSWYLGRYPDVKESGMNPLVHYIQYGDSEERNPSEHFNTRYYLSQKPELGLNETALGHYLRIGYKETFSPNVEFDKDFYLQQLANSGLKAEDPYRHYLEVGMYEGLSAAPDKNVSVYHRADEKFLEAGECYEDLQFDLEGVDLDIKMIAFYLPQFHTFEENDEWWGKGFTEWRNVVRGRSRYKGHYQPRLPRDFGYYDLTNTQQIMAEQIALAKRAGLHGFCFYYYRFDTKRLLELPLENFLADKSLNMPFCLTWANENWTRTWDGMDDNVLMRQSYDPSGDVELIDDLARYFADPRYIRINDKPLFIIYRPGIVPEASERIDEWRALFKARHDLDVLFYMVQGFGDEDPREFSMDGAIEFPPHKLMAGAEPINASLELTDDFTGNVFLYEDMIGRSLDEPKPEYNMVKGICPDWDNESRRPNRGMAFHGSTPQKYRYWLEGILKYAKQNPVDGESLVFVNAWNEWAEGAYLEPDIHYGSAYLNATAQALQNSDVNSNSATDKCRVIYVGHDAHKHGAQLLSLHIVEQLIAFGVDVQVILLQGGDLVEQYQRIAPTHVISEGEHSFTDVIKSLSRQGYSDLAITNTTVTGSCVKALADNGYKIISLVHELQNLITEYGLIDAAKDIAQHSDSIVFASDFVRRSFEGVVGQKLQSAKVMPQGVYKNLEPAPNARQRLLDQLGVQHAEKIIINAGFADLRKGFDLFVQAAQNLIDSGYSYHFVWLGAVEVNLGRWVYDVLDDNYKSHIHILPFTDDVATALDAADLFLLTSREDPFPSVVMEALGCGLPVVGFSGGGGFVDLLGNEKLGALATLGNVESLVASVLDQLQSDSKEKREYRIKTISENYCWKSYVFSLLQLLEPKLKKVSVVVPNYNYAQYIADRLASIFAQSYPIYETIILDDCSPDNSLEVIDSVCKKQNRANELVINKKNSGNVFKQWKKGVDLASGDYIWIAEADDLAEPEFLATLCNSADDFTMAFCDSKQIDENGKHLADSYSYYYQGVGDGLLADVSCSGEEFVEVYLAMKNVVMNVSGVIFSRDKMLGVIRAKEERLFDFSVAGDWFLYINLLGEKNSTLEYSAQSLNVHRRHSNSVTRSLAAKKHLREVEDMQKLVREKFHVTEDKVDESAVYLKELYRQFNLEA